MCRQGPLAKVMMKIIMTAVVAIVIIIQKWHFITRNRNISHQNLTSGEFVEPTHRKYFFHGDLSCFSSKFSSLVIIYNDTIICHIWKAWPSQWSAMLTRTLNCEVTEKDTWTASVVDKYLIGDWN